MKKEDYFQILQENLKSSAADLVLGALSVLTDCKHTSEVVKKLLNQSGIEVLEWFSDVLMSTPSRTCGLSSLCQEDSYVSCNVL